MQRNESVNAASTVISGNETSDFHRVKACQVESYKNTRKHRNSPISKIFTPEEDEFLFNQIRNHGLDFKKISKNFEARTHIQLKKRYEKINHLQKLFPQANLVIRIPSNLTISEANSEETEVINKALYPSKNEISKSNKVVNLLGQKRKYLTLKTVADKQVHSSTSTKSNYFSSTITYECSITQPKSYHDKESSCKGFNEDIFMANSELCDYYCNQSITNVELPNRLNDTLEEMNLKIQCQEISEELTNTSEFAKIVSSSNTNTLQAPRSFEFLSKLNSKYIKIFKAHKSCLSSEELKSKLLTNNDNELFLELTKLDSCYEKLTARYTEFEVKWQNIYEIDSGCVSKSNQMLNKLYLILTDKLEKLCKLIKLLNLKLTWKTHVNSFYHQELKLVE